MGNTRERQAAYKWENWERDVTYWSSQGASVSSSATNVSDYFHRLYPQIPHREENLARLWAALVFLDTKMPELLKTGIAEQDGTGKIMLPDSFKRAMYGTFMSLPADALERQVDLAMISWLANDGGDAAAGA